MNEYTLEEARELLKPFGISIYTNTDCDGNIWSYGFQSNNCDRMEKADGYDSQSLKPSDFNMIIDGFVEEEV